MFFRWASRRAPETQPIRLRQSRIYVVPTRAGLALLVTLGIMLLASINYNLSLGYGFTFLLAGVGLAHILQSWRPLVGLEISVTPEGEAFAGGLAHFTVSLGNPHTRERPALVVLSAQGQEQARVDLAARSTTGVRLSIPALQRGLLRPEFIVIETRQPLGWVRAWSYLRPHVEHIVYPRCEGDLPMPLGAGQSAEGEGRVGGGQDDFAGVREFQLGDSPRHVAWKSVARGQGLLTKVFEGLQSPELVFDYAALPENMPLEARLSQLAAWVSKAREEQLRTELLLPYVQLGPGNSIAHHTECLRQLALFSQRPLHG